MAHTISAYHLHPVDSHPLQALPSVSLAVRTLHGGGTTIKTLHSSSTAFKTQHSSSAVKTLPNVVVRALLSCAFKNRYGSSTVQLEY